MSKNHLTEGKVCAAANEGVFTPHLVLYVLRSNCPTLPVKLDYPFAHRRAVAGSRHFRRITVRLFDFSRRLGNTRDHRRLLDAIGYVPPAEFEKAYHRNREESADAT